jgi:hypothetical protein
MWLGPLHDSGFCKAVVESVEREKENYKTFARIKGMVSVARDVSPPGVLDGDAADPFVGTADNVLFYALENR